MRMFYFVADYFPAWRFDVVELFGLELPKRGVDVVWSMRRDDAGLCEVKEQNGQRVYLPASFGRRRKLARIGNRLLEALCEAYWFLILLAGPRYDVIQVRDDRYLAGFWAWIAARLTGARFVYWLSFPFPENDAEKSLRSSGLQRALLATRSAVTGWWLYGFLLRRADLVFVQSEEMSREIAKLGVPVERMTPVPMAIPERLLDFASQRRSDVIPGRVAYVGTLAAARRLETILEAFALVLRRCPHAQLFMVGEGDSADERIGLERRATELGLTDAVHFTGHVPVDTAWEILSTAAVGLSPVFPDRVLKVGSPTKLVEYMAMSIPTICNDHPEQSAVIRDSGAGLCVVWSAEAFADAIAGLLEQPAEASALGAKGPPWVAEHRTYPIIAEHVIKRYRLLLANEV